MTINEKAAVVVELGMVRLTQFDTMKRVVGAAVSARNLDVAQVRYTREKGLILVPTCRHTSADGAAFDHDCEGHSHGHVCYHSRAGLLMAAAVAGATLSFHDTENEARAAGRIGALIVRVMVPGNEEKQVWAAFSRK